MKVLFLGSKEIGYACLKALVLLDRDSIAGVLTVHDLQDSRSHYHLINALCEQCQIPFYATPDGKDIGVAVNKVKPDLCLVVGWYWLITKKVLDQVSQIIGVHHSFLPEYRGGSPLVWQIINGEDHIGSSIFTIEEGMDTGDIWAQYKVALGIDDYVSDVIEILNKRTVTTLTGIWPGILSGDHTPVPQVGTPTYCAQRIPEDGKIDWNRSAIQVYNFIRAQSYPYPGAFTVFRGEQLKIWKAQLVEDEYYGTPGQVARVSPGGVHIICGDNKAVIIETDILKSFKIRL